MTKPFYLALESDHYSYHIAYIWEGIRRYVEQSSTGIRFFPLGVKLLDSMINESFPSIGVIGLFHSQGSVKYLLRKKLPWLDLSGQHTTSGIGPTVTFKGEGHRAADFFINSLGLKNLGFYGLTNIDSYERRRLEYHETASAHKLRVHTYLEINPSPKNRVFYEGERKNHCIYNEIKEFLRSIPKPAGIFCGNDMMALTLKILAESIGIKVPRDISILGVGSLHRGTGGWQESVSVVQLDHERVGFEAAGLMEHYLLHGEIKPTVVLTAGNVIHRFTTLRREINNSVVQQAYALIMGDLGITIEELCLSLGIARRTLESHFQSGAGKSVGSVVDEERFKRASELLKNHKYNMQSVASLSGYSNIRNLRNSFLRNCGVSPINYRKRHKGREDAI